MTKRGFYFDNTCPSIDKQIKDAKQIIANHIEDVVFGVKPEMKSEEKSYIVSDESKILFERLEDVFENVRQTNIDMRDAAEIQIARLESEIEYLKQEIDDLTKQNNT